MRARRVDATQDEIVRALERAGCLVWFIGEPFDLLVCRAGKLSLLEPKSLKVYERKTKRGFRQVKSPGKLTPLQEKALAAGWPAVVVWSAEDALRAVGLGRLRASAVPF